MIRIAIIEGDRSYSTALSPHLNKVGDMEGIITATTLKDLPDLLLTNPHIVILDTDLDIESGMQSIRQIKETLSSTGILILTDIVDEEKIFQFIKAGISGIMLKKDPPEKIVEAVRSIQKGEAAINGQIARKILDFFSGSATKTRGLDDYNLTRREKEIIQLLIEGLSYKEMAARCYISIDTLNSHIRNIYSKLSMHSRSEIAAHFRLLK